MISDCPKGLRFAALYLFIERPCFENLGRQKEFVGEFLIPLLAQIGWNNNEQLRFRSAHF